MAKLSAEEIRLRGLLLAKNKDLLQLHRNLVMTGMVTEDEFWATRRHLLESQQMLLQQKRPPTTSSILGLDIKPQSDIQGDLKFVLTPALIQSIFEQNPTIKRAYQEKVPSSVDEKTFWMQYFTSKFFKEGLTSSAGAVSEKASPTGNILDEYYMESQLDAEGSLALKPLDTIPVSIDIMATTEDHYQVADVEARPDEPRKVERARTAAIKKLNKLSAGIVESSGSMRIGSTYDEAMSDLMADTEVDRYVGLAMTASVLDQKRDLMLDEVHWNRLLSEWDDEAKQCTVPISYSNYLEIMGKHRPAPALSDETLFTVDKLTVITAVEFQTFNSNMIELLRQFWSAYPPGSNTELQDKVTRMSDLLEQMLQNLDRWSASCVSLIESQFLKSSFDHLRRSAELAVSNAHQQTTSAGLTASKRAKINA